MIILVNGNYKRIFYFQNMIYKGKVDASCLKFIPLGYQYLLYAGPNYHGAHVLKLYHSQSQGIHFSFNPLMTQFAQLLTQYGVISNILMKI